MNFEMQPKTEKVLDKVWWFFLLLLSRNLRDIREIVKFSVWIECWNFTDVPKVTLQKYGKCP